METLEATYEAERRAARVVTELDELPISYEHISTEWLTKLLCGEVEGAEVTDVRAEDVDELNRGHKRLLLSYNEVGTVAGLPESVFCKDSQQLGLRRLASVTAVTEVGFYREIQPLLGLETPSCLLANYDPRSFNSLLVFEDLGNKGAAFCTESTPITRERAEGQVGYLARLHSRFAGEVDSNPLFERFGGLTAMYDGMQRSFFDGRLGEAADRGFLTSEPVIPSSLFKRFAEVWPATERALDIQRSRRTTLTHNDCHVCNWYLTSNGAMRLGDWQVVGAGDRAFDLGFTLVTSLDVEDRRAWERELLELYCENLAEHGGPRLRLPDLWDGYRTQLLVGLAWWTPVVKASSGDFEFDAVDSALRIIGRLAAAIDDLDSFEALDALERA